MSPRIEASTPRPLHHFRYHAGPELGGVRSGEGLARGHSGAGVHDLQSLLNAAGAQPPLAEDGLFGPKTQAALRQAQARLGIPVTGALDASTLRALEAAPRPARPSSPPGDGIEPARTGPAPRAPLQNAPAPEGSVPAHTVAREPRVARDPRVPASAPAGPAPVVAGGIPDRIIDRTARFESGRRYDAWNPDDAGHGVSFGLIQFNQRSGTLPTLVQRMSQANPQRFDEIFGPHAANMQSPSYVRSADLNDPDLRARLERAGREPEFQQVQRDLARTGYYDPAARMAERHGLHSERALAMLFDSSVQNGTGGTDRFLRQAAEGGGSEREVLERFARLADRGAANGRRTRILNDASFSDAAPAAAPVAPAAPAAPATPTTGPIGPGTRVLMIGDSHTVGTYGREMDSLLRSTGASVESYGSSGSSPSWWMRGTPTSSGFVGRHADGTVEQPADWRTSHVTPRLRDLIAQQHPDVLVVSLGGNMRGMTDAQIQRQVRELGEVARESGTRLVWAGPPSRREDAGDHAEIDRFDRVMREAVAPFGNYVASSRYTEYSGADGIHYSGARGNEIARGWARGVFGEIQGQ